MLRFVLPVALLGFALIAGYWIGHRDRATTPNPGVAGIADAGGFEPGAAPPPLTGSMRDQADRLFDRIMQARARGDSAEAAFFLPMALQAYGAVGPLDADGLFHLGLLQLEAGQTADAAATADRIAAIDPNHLFGSALRAEAALVRGDTADAAGAYRAFAASFDAEMARSAPEYELHRPALDEYRDRARLLSGS